MLSRCFYFRVSQIFVSSLFLPQIHSTKLHCVSDTYEELTGFQEEDHDGRWRMYLPRGCSSGSPSLLRSLNEQRTVIPYGSRTKRQSIRLLPNFQGLAKASGVHGHTGTLYHLGGLCRRWSHPWFHHRVLHTWVCGRSDSSCCFPLYWCSSYLP